MSDKEIFTREETSNLIQQARKQGALEELKKIQRMNHRDWKTGNTTLANQYSKIMNKIDKRIKELGGETK